MKEATAALAKLQEEDAKEAAKIADQSAKIDTLSKELKDISKFL